MVNGSGTQHSEPIPKKDPKPSPPTEASEKGDRHAEVTQDNPDRSGGITKAGEAGIIAGTRIGLR